MSMPCHSFFCCVVVTNSQKPGRGLKKIAERCSFPSMCRRHLFPPSCSLRGSEVSLFCPFLQGCLTLRSGPLRNRPVAASPHMHWEGRCCTWLRAWPSSSSALHSTRGCGTLPTPPRAPGGTTTWTSKSCRPGIAVCVGPVSAIFKRLAPGGEENRVGRSAGPLPLGFGQVGPRGGLFPLFSARISESFCHPPKYIWSLLLQVVGWVLSG